MIETIPSLYKVRALNPVLNSLDWIEILVNTDKVAYVQPLKEGDLIGHYVVGFDFREYICHQDDIHLLFEI